MRLATLLGVVLVSACSAPEDPEPRCSVASEQQALVQGTAAESFLGLAPDQLDAIVAIQGGAAEDSPLCSGAFVAPNWVLTAGHCLAIESPEVMLTRASARPLALPVVERVGHPTLDLALLKVDASAADRIPTPLPGLTRGALSLGPGDLVELAGYGAAEGGRARELTFLVEPIVSLEGGDLLVDGRGASGACFGDSGGPLLARDRSGSVVVVGILSAGSASCLHRDRYVGVEAVSAWLEQWTGAVGSNNSGCGGIDEQGRCLYGTAIWCSAGALSADACGVAKACGWSDAAGGFRCKPPATDRCMGADTLGVCSAGEARHCRSGTLERTRCDCGQSCRTDPKTGMALCGAEHAPAR